MANMSYCRFYNTRRDMNDCIESLKNRETMSGDEARDGRWMFEELLDFCKEIGFITEYDNRSVEEFFDELNEDNKEEDDDNE